MNTQISLTPKQLEILILLYRFRYLTRYQLQKILNHQRSYRIKQWLSELTSLKIINRISPQPLQRHAIPDVYHLSSKSIPYLKDTDSINAALLKKHYSKNIQSDAFMNHNLLIADLYLKYQQDLHPAQQLYFYTRSDMAAYDYFLQPLPDAYVSIKENNFEPKRIFIEIFSSQLSKAMIKKRIKTYLEYAESEEWEASTKFKFPTIVLICPTIETKKYIEKSIADLQEEIISNPTFLVIPQKELQSQSII